MSTGMSFRRLAFVFAVVLGSLGAGCASNAPREADAGAQVSQADVAAWRTALAHRRQRNLERLHAYAEKGVFPLNDKRGPKANIFVDDVGVHCAVANLMMLDGDEDLVQATAKKDNFTRLGDVKDGPLMKWMLTSGFTQEEIALIQEPYVQRPKGDDKAAAMERNRLQAHFASLEKKLRTETDASLDVAMARLPGTVLSSPPPWVPEPAAV